jgi:exodeoxyribonuclease-3
VSGVRITTWNVNSVKQRVPRLLPWLDERKPDVVCLQETKLADDAFPTMGFASLGYDAVHHGEGRWNGVAILSRVGIEDVVDGFADGGAHDGEARLLTATCGGVRVATMYVPNGREVGHEQYVRKLEWLARVRAHLDAVGDPSDDVVLCGDFNIAPDDRDVYNPAAWEGKVLCTPAERAALAALGELGLRDAFRLFEQPERIFSWWDYRAGAFRRNQGLRIDLVLASHALSQTCTGCRIDKEPRGWERPSDHVPVVAEFATS